MKDLKIVIVTNIPSPYRVNFYYYMQTNYKNYDIHVIYTSYNEDNRQWSIDSEKLVNTHFLKSKIFKIKTDMDNRYIHLPANMRRLLSELKPEVIVAMEYNMAALQCLVWCKSHRVPFIHLTDGTLNSEKNINYIQKISRKLITRFASACIASSSKAKEKLLCYGVDESRIFTSLLTIDNKQYKVQNTKRVSGRMLYVGSMIKRKGIDLLINALPYVESKWHLHIVGNGNDEEKKALQTLAEMNNIEKNIIWCGYKEGDDLILEYEEAEVFVLPTREDCFGLVLLESLYAGTPIISSKYADGAYDIVKAGVNGLIIDPFDSKTFAKALDIILNDKEYQNRALRADTSLFSLENVSRNFIEAVDYVIQDK